MSNEPGVLVCGLCVCSFTGDVVKAFAMLSLIPSNHVDWLLQQVEIEVLIGTGWSEIKISVYKRLASGIK